MTATLLRTCLEGAVVAAVVAAACAVVPRMRATHRAMLWWLVAAKLLLGLLPLPAIPIEALSAPAEAPAALAAAAPAPTTVATTPMEALSAAIPSPPPASALRRGLWLWLAGAAALLACALPGWLRARSWRRAGRPIDDSDVALSVARAARAVGLRREPRVLAVPGLPGPLVTGLLRPTILLPIDSLARLRAADLEMVLAHEMAHIARGDLWWGLVPALARRLFFFHPAAWIAEREYALAREAACDEAVLRPGADPHAYGLLLLRFATRPAGSASLPMSPHALLRRRLQMIESIVRRVPLGRAGWALVVLVALALVPVRLVAKEDATRCLDVGEDVESAYVITSGTNHAMCGDLSDVREAERARGAGGDVLWFRIGDERWVIRDPESVAQARRRFLAIRELAERDAAMAADRAEVARRQAAEERRRAELDVRSQALAEQELRAATEARAKSAEDAERDLKRLEAEMEALSQRLHELGLRRQELGERQHALSEFLEDAIRSGRAERAE